MKRLIFGNPLPKQRAIHERLILPLALAILASDALSSVAYGPEQILHILFEGNQDALFLILPISLALVGLIWMVIFSYRQLLLAYPHGGGSYSVAKENLGKFWGFVAGAALSLDYVLTVAVSLMAGVAAIYSAWPELHVNRVELTLGILLFMTLINLRGVRESGWVFGVPTYLFIGSMMALLMMGLVKLIQGESMPLSQESIQLSRTLDWFLILKAFSSGATTLTGIEAISNGVGIFRQPQDRNARTSLIWLGLMLSVMLLGMVYITQHLGLAPKATETLLSQLARWSFSGGFGYYFLQLSTFLVLFLAANAAFNGFPQLAAAVAKDGYLPRQLRNLGDRLVYSNGIVALALLAGLLIVIFESKVESIIPLYAIGVFTAFTLSQFGMVAFNYSKKSAGWRRSIFINIVGGTLTSIVALIFAVTKFTEGAWIIVVLMPLLVLIPYAVHSHYASTANQLSLQGIEGVPPVQPVIAICPINALHKGTLQAISYAQSISQDLHIIHISINSDETARLKERFSQWCPNLELKILPSPDQSFLQVFDEYLNLIQKNSRNAIINVVVPEFVPSKFVHHLLHNQTALMFKLHLYGKESIVVTNVPYHLKS